MRRGAPRHPNTGGEEGVWCVAPHPRLRKWIVPPAEHRRAAAAAPADAAAAARGVPCCAQTRSTAPNSPRGMCPPHAPPRQSGGARPFGGVRARLTSCSQHAPRCRRGRAPACPFVPCVELGVCPGRAVRGVGRVLGTRPPAGDRGTQKCIVRANIAPHVERLAWARNPLFLCTLMACSVGGVLMTALVFVGERIARGRHPRDGPAARRAVPRPKAARRGERSVPSEMLFRTLFCRSRGGPAAGALGPARVARERAPPWLARVGTAWRALSRPSEGARARRADRAARRAPRHPRPKPSRGPRPPAPRARAAASGNRPAWHRSGNRPSVGGLPHLRKKTRMSKRIYRVVLFAFFKIKTFWSNIRFFLSHAANVPSQCTRTHRLFPDLKNTVNIPKSARLFYFPRRREKTSLARLDTTP